MTLHEFLVENGLKLDKSTESRLGNIIGNRYRETYKKSPIKHKEKVHGISVKINHYPPTFLQKCTEDIIQFLNPVQV